MQTNRKCQNWLLFIQIKVALFLFYFVFCLFFPFKCYMLKNDYRYAILLFGRLLHRFSLFIFSMCRRVCFFFVVVVVYVFFFQWFFSPVFSKVKNFQLSYFRKNKKWRQQRVIVFNSSIKMKEEKTRHALNNLEVFHVIKKHNSEKNVFRTLSFRSRNMGSNITIAEFSKRLFLNNTILGRLSQRTVQLKKYTGNLMRENGYPKALIVLLARSSKSSWLSVRAPSPTTDHTKLCALTHKL